MSHERVLKVVQDCEAVCEGTLTAVLSMVDVQSRVMQIHLLHDCADICTLTAKYIARYSSFAKHIAHLCAHICEVCGKHCLMHPDPQSQHCGRVCLDCAKECRAFSGMMTMPMSSPDLSYPDSGCAGIPGMYSEPEKKDEKK